MNMVRYGRGCWVKFLFVKPECLWVQQCVSGENSFPKIEPTWKMTLWHCPKSWAFGVWAISGGSGVLKQSLKSDFLCRIKSRSVGMGRWVWRWLWILWLPSPTRVTDLLAPKISPRSLPGTLLYFIFYSLYFIFCILYFIFYILYSIFYILYFKMLSRAS